MRALEAEPRNAVRETSESSCVDSRLCTNYKSWLAPKLATDAGVFALHDGLALVQTVDVITSVVDEPYLDVTRS